MMECSFAIGRPVLINLCLMRSDYSIIILVGQTLASLLCWHPYYGGGGPDFIYYSDSE